MQFNSLTFAALFAAVLLVHHAPLSWRTRKAGLLVASYLFYAAWNPPFVVLLWISTLVDWSLARRIHCARKPTSRRWLLAASLAVNLGLLGFFKYAAFAAESFAALAAHAGIAWQPALPDIALPVGISFYTFQTLSYTLDVYRRRSAPWPSFLDYALYVTFFPQLVAGPIVRADQFLPQCATPRRARPRQLGWGMTLLVIGLFEKVVIADGVLAPIVELVYDGDGVPSTAAAWAATLAFAGQIYCDFAGYSTCAIGVALCLGFALPDNFRFPYAAIGFSDFWRRWHVSLSTWLRDYVYIPLGGNRRGPARCHAALMLTMLVGGLWHGASWTFVVWGGLHGLFLVAERALRHHVPDRALWRTPVVRLVLALTTFGGVCVAWVFFRASDFDSAFVIVAALFGQGGEPDLGIPTRSFRLATITITLLLLEHHAMRETTLEATWDRMPGWLRPLLLALMLCAIATVPGEDRAFIYFRF